MQCECSRRPGSASRYRSRAHAVCASHVLHEQVRGVRQPFYSSVLGMVDARATTQQLQVLVKYKGHAHNAENLIITHVLQEIVRAP